MGLLADRIEKLILKKLVEADENIILKRNELANELDCAPSQISYVLSTRFSNDKGFIVESRRGLGGFISITRISDDDDEEPMTVTYNTPMIPVQAESLTKADMNGDHHMPMSIEEIDRWLGTLLYRGEIENREARIIHSAFASIINTLPSSARTRTIAYLFHAIMHEIRGE